MNYVFLSKKLYIDLTGPIAEEVSPYDAKYPISLLFEGLNSD